MKERPGVLLYFSLRPAIKRLTLEEKGALFEAILDYAQNGVYPDFDGVLGIGWDFVQPLIDADGEAYRDKCEKAKKAIETVGLTPLSRPVRGGTDGARLSFMGLPCPNLGTGGYGFHGPFEHISVEGMDTAVSVIKEIVKITAD